MDREYLDSLIEDCAQRRKSFVFTPLHAENLAVSYIPTKKTSFIGYKQGFYEMVNRRVNGIEQTDKAKGQTASEK